MASPIFLLLFRRKPFRRYLRGCCPYLEIYLRPLYPVEEFPTLVSGLAQLPPFPSILANFVFTLGSFRRNSSTVSFGWTSHCCPSQPPHAAHHHLSLWQLRSSWPQEGRRCHHHQPRFTNPPSLYRHGYEDAFVGPHRQRSLGTGFDNDCSLAAHGRGGNGWCFRR